MTVLQPHTNETRNTSATASCNPNRWPLVCALNLESGKTIPSQYNILYYTRIQDKTRSTHFIPYTKQGVRGVIAGARARASLRSLHLAMSRRMQRGDADRRSPALAQHDYSQYDFFMSIIRFIITATMTIAILITSILTTLMIIITSCCDDY